MQTHILMQMCVYFYFIHVLTRKCLRPVLEKKDALALMLKVRLP